MSLWRLIMHRKNFGNRGKKSNKTFIHLESIPQGIKPFIEVEAQGLLMEAQNRKKGNVVGTNILGKEWIFSRKISWAAIF